MTRLRADALLLITAIIWGTAFVAQKAANETMGPITFVGARFLFSALVVLPLAWRESRQAQKPVTRRAWFMAGVIGLCLLTGSVLQQTALLTTSVTNGGFLTALYVVMVPFTTWFLTRERISRKVLAASAISLLGAYLLSAHGSLQPFAFGDFLLIVSDVAWSFGISLVGLFLTHVPRAFFLSLVQYSVTAVLGLGIGLAIEPVYWDGIVAAMPAILYAGLISGGIAFTMQNIAQRHTPAPEAALIMSLESVFAAIAGAIFLGERLGAIALVGCALIMAGVIVAELGPALFRKRAL